VLTRKRASAAGPPGFLEFWAAYPRKVGKLAAQRSWKSRGCEPMAERIVAAVRSQLDWPDGEGLNKRHDLNGGGGNPHPSTWLNQGRWDDELPSSARREQPEDIFDEHGNLVTGAER
jgi:hypothetical protein